MQMFSTQKSFQYKKKKEPLGKEVNAFQMYNNNIVKYEDKCLFTELHEKANLSTLCM